VPVLQGPRGSLNVVTLGSGPPLLLLHGLFVGSAAQWYFTSAPALATRYRVIMMDLPSHGRSERRADGYDLGSLVADVRAVVEGLELEGVRLAGHSYGGLVSLAYATRYPIQQLALVDVPLPGQTQDAALSSADALLDAIPGPVREALDKGGRRARRLLESVGYLATQTSLLADMEAETAPDASKVQCPTLLVYGSKSGCLDSEAVLRASLAQVQSVMLDGGHFLPAEAPEALTRALAEFFIDG